MTELPFFIKILIALALGALVGIEREKSKQEKHDFSIAGIRSMILVSLFGAVAAFLSQEYSIWIFVISFASLALLTAMSYIFLAFKRKMVGITTEITVIFVFLLGALIMFGHTSIALVVGIVMTLVLSIRTYIHSWVRRISPLEFLDTIKFALIAFVILPFLPRETVDPWGLFSPYKIWLFVVIFSGISFLGYILSKWIGAKRGINVTAFVAGLLSSTAMVSTIGARVKGLKINMSPYAMAAIVAFLGSFVPTVFEIALLNRPLLATIILPMSIVAVIGIVCVFFIGLSKSFKKATDAEAPKLKSPFSLKAGLEFGLLLLTIHSLVVLGQRYLGDAGIYITSAISGMASMDAITLSMAELGGKTVPLNIAARAVLIGLAVSAMSKIGVLYVFGRGSIVRRAGPFFCVLSASLLATAFFLL